MAHVLAAIGIYIAALVLQFYDDGSLLTELYVL